MVNEMTLVCKKCGRTYHLYPYQWDALKHKKLCGYCWDKQWTQRLARIRARICGYLADLIGAGGKR